ncbi:polymer-forming cytoskeletal protein [uncultured Brevundimonas sp.]|uniref:bactofilin family protein n=1 Tax=uncultured Brevundimonas sp. TaxID=213418 RepID=UPI002621DDC0|nr:polymer-forming cytoskeletal protein [uncultured Brevundimonas sp.]
MGTASSHDDTGALDDTELEELELDTEVLDDFGDDDPSPSYSHASEEREAAVEEPAPPPTAASDDTVEPPLAASSGWSPTGSGTGGGYGSGSGGGFGGGSTPPSRPTREAASVLGTGMTFEGDISGVGQLVIEGTVKGDVRVSQVLINEKGAVEGTVHADFLDVRGRVTGAIVAKQVHLHPTAKVEGDITQEELTIERGAWFSGRSTQAKRGTEEPATA